MASDPSIFSRSTSRAPKATCSPAAIFAAFAPASCCSKRSPPAPWRRISPNGNPSCSTRATSSCCSGLNRFYVAREDAALIARFPKEAAPWLVVPHLGHTNRAPDRTDHPDHAFARALVAGFLARLPRPDPELLLAFILDESQTELRREPDASDRAAAIARLFPVDKHPDGVPGPTGIDAANVRELYAKLMETDQFRIMLGRIAASYDGGQILD